MSAWTKLVDLFALVGRPLVFFDFETASLKGNPCEFAIIALDSNAEPSPDETTTQARDALGEFAHGVAYATASRLDPGQEFSQGASAVHGITASGVAGCPRFDDAGVAGLFQAFAAEGAVWAGHNVCGYDLPLAVRLGYLPEVPDALDSMRVVRRIQAEDDPRPDAWDPTAHEPVPACYGLDLFRANLTAVHYAVTGERFDGAHGALADVIASIRVMARLVDLWISEDVMIKIMAEAADPAQALAQVIAFLNQPPKGQVGWSGWLRVIDVDGEPFYEMARGKHQGSSLADVGRDDSDYLSYILGGDSPPDESEAAIIRAHMVGERVGSSGWLRDDGSNVVLCKGKFKGRPLAEVAKEAPGYLHWILKQDDTDDSTALAIESALLVDDIPF